MHSPARTPRSKPCFAPRAQHAFQRFSSDAGLVFSGGPALTSSPQALGILWGPTAFQSLQPPREQAIRMEMPTFENKGFPIWGFINLA